MGDACWECGRKYRVRKGRGNLECHRIAPNHGWEPSKRCQASRVAEYWRQWLLGNLALLCEGCHGAATRKLAAGDPVVYGVGSDYESCFFPPEPPLLLTACSGQLRSDLFRPHSDLGCCVSD